MLPQRCTKLRAVSRFDFAFAATFPRVHILRSRYSITKCRSSADHEFRVKFSHHFVGYQCHVRKFRLFSTRSQGVKGVKVSNRDWKSPRLPDFSSQKEPSTLLRRTVHASVCAQPNCHCQKVTPDNKYYILFASRIIAAGLRLKHAQGKGRRRSLTALDLIVMAAQFRQV